MIQVAEESRPTFAKKFTMNRSCRLTAITLVLTSFWLTSTSHAQLLEEQVMQASAVVFNEAMTAPLNRIPQAMLSNANAVAIVPNVIKGSFIVGARRGRGLLFVREPEGVWHAPVFITLTGGNIGWQVGVQSSDIILVFKTERSVQGILSGKLTLGADAAAAAGPVGRETAVATDGQLQAEIYTYSRTRGLFAGVSIDGSVLQVDPWSTGAYYRSPAPGQPVVVPPLADQLTQTVASYANTTATPPIPITAQDQQSGWIQQHAATHTEGLRAQLVQLAPKLYDMLDDQWKNYLALPSSLFLDGTPTTPEQLQITLDHFNVANSDPRFQGLSSRPEFQSVFNLLKLYQQSLTQDAATLQLPPPPPIVR
tara:strand:- start:6912 stop:8012 length:1101 start_codon:yes stop_codon:yes gene_type:complete